MGNVAGLYSPPRPLQASSRASRSGIFPQQQVLMRAIPATAPAIVADEPQRVADAVWERKLARYWAEVCEAGLGRFDRSAPSEKLHILRGRRRN